MYIFLAMTACRRPIFFPQLSVKKLIWACLMQAASILLFQGILYLGEKIPGTFISAQRIAAEKQLEGTANLFTL